MSQTIHGTVVKTYYSDAQFSAGVIATDDGTQVRFRGRLYAAEGDRLSAIGQWTMDPKYGHQFEIKQLDYELPQTREGLINYLSKHPAFVGVGQKSAERIVDVLDNGEDLSEALRSRLDDFVAAGVPRKTLEALAESWNQHAGENAVRSYLAGYGLTPHQMQTLLEKFGTSIVSVLKHDPYLLIKHLAGYGFKKVDQIALKLGIAKTHPGRIEAALSYCVAQQISNGHTWTLGSELVTQANEALVIDTLDSRDLIQAAGNRLIASGDLIADGCAVTLPWLHRDEQLIEAAFQGAVRGDDETPDVLTCRPEDDLSDDQREAFETAVTNRISVISGGAGTGKTYVVARLARRFQEAGLVVSLAAPTGKAAKRIEQLLRAHGVDLSASTIHRLLGYNGIAFREDILPADVVIIDEVSMVDVPLMAELLRHIDPRKTRMILVGDHNQLPPVGPGNVLRDMIQHNLVPATVMTKVHRQAGVLKTNSVGVLNGQLAPTATDDQSRWMVVNRFRDAQAIKHWLRDLVLTDIPKQFGFDPVHDVQIITPEHRGPLGTRSLNQMMQYLLRPRNGTLEESKPGRSLPGAGDKVIQTRNDYELGVMNGTIGFVREVGKSGLVIDFEGKEDVEVDWNKAKSVELAYALTAHKAQGSEFPCAVVLCHKSHFFADRNWLYTAVTRAAHTCVLVGDDYGLRRAAGQVRNTKRRTWLSLWASRSQQLQEAAA